MKKIYLFLSLNLFLTKYIIKSITNKITISKSINLTMYSKLSFKKINTIIRKIQVRKYFFIKVLKKSFIYYLLKNAATILLAIIETTPPPKAEIVTKACFKA